MHTSSPGSIARPRPEAACLIAGGVLVVVGLLPLAMMAFFYSQTSAARAVAAVVFVSMPGLALLFTGLVIRATDPPAGEDRQAEPPRCPQCGYDMRGGTGRCPECGGAAPGVLV